MSSSSCEKCKKLELIEFYFILFYFKKRELSRVLFEVKITLGFISMQALKVCLDEEIKAGKIFQQIY